MQAISLFSGVGGFELGFEAAGIETILQAEIAPDCLAVLERHWPGIPKVRDVRDIDGRRYEGIDLLYGGFPCQDISNSYTRSGGQAGLGGERSGLWWAFHHLAQETEARWLVIENVQNLLRSNAGRDFRAVLGSLDDLGYGVAWSLLDARGFGIPQQRRRLYLVGHRGERGAWAPSEVLDHAGRRQRHAEEGYGRGKAYATITEAEARSAGPLCVAENQQAEFRLLPFSPTLTTGGGKIGQGYQGFIWGDTFRRFTLEEQEALMGWPRGHTRYRADGTELSATRRQEMIGNGVASPVARWIGERIVQHD